MNDFGKLLSGILIIAILAVVVSSKSQTVSMMQSASGLFQKLLSVHKKKLKNIILKSVKTFLNMMMCSISSAL